MTVALLHWALFMFLLGLALSLPLAATVAVGAPTFRRIFVRPQKLKSAHLDFFMQGFSLGLVYLVESRLPAPLPGWVVALLAYGGIGNPLLFLFESMPLLEHPVGSKVFPLFVISSVGALYVAWTAVGWFALPGWMGAVWLGLAALMAVPMLVYARAKGATPAPMPQP